jgi:hypothetical protein
MAWGKLYSRARGDPKIRKLARRLSIEPPYALGLLATLWAWCLEHRPDGCLADLDAEDIATAAEWPGDEVMFQNALVGCRLVDEVSGILQVHDWMDYAGSWKEAQRKKAERERRAQDCPGKSRKVQESPSTEERRGEERKREERRREEHKGKGEAGASRSPGLTLQASSDVQQVVDHWLAKPQQSGRKPTKWSSLASSSDEYRKIKARLKEGFSVDQLKKAIDGAHKTPHNLGDNDRDQVYLSMKIIFKDMSQVQRFMGNDDNPPIGRAWSKTKERAGSIQRWSDAKQKRQQ